MTRVELGVPCYDRDVISICGVLSDSQCVCVCSTHPRLVGCYLPVFRRELSKTQGQITRGSLWPQQCSLTASQWALLIFLVEAGANSKQALFITATQIGQLVLVLCALFTRNLSGTRQWSTAGPKYCNRLWCSLRSSASWKARKVSTS